MRYLKPLTEQPNARAGPGGLAGSPDPASNPGEMAQQVVVGSRPLRDLIAWHDEYMPVG